MGRQIQTAFLISASLVSTACSAAEPTDDPAIARDPSVSMANTESDPYQKREVLSGAAMNQQRVVISSDWGRVTAELVENDATRALIEMLPVTINMRDHLRQEKTGSLPSPLPETTRQAEFAKGMLGLWGSDDFVIYYRDGRVPQPGIIVLGHMVGDVSIFDRPGEVTVRLERAN